MKINQTNASTESHKLFLEKVDAWKKIDNVEEMEDTLVENRSLIEKELFLDNIEFNSEEIFQVFMEYCLLMHESNKEIPKDAQLLEIEEGVLQDLISAALTIGMALPYGKESAHNLYIAAKSRTFEDSAAKIIDIIKQHSR